MAASQDNPSVNYGSYVIVHQPEGNHRRRTDSYAVLRRSESGDLITHHAELATPGVKFDTEDEGYTAAIRRGKEWIDSQESKSE